MSNSASKPSSVGRKILMALSGFFLMIFLLQHFVINLSSVFSKDVFNSWSEFMGTNPIVQFGLQPVLFAGIIYHFVMGIKLEIMNNSKRSTKYAMNKASANSSWVSRNMIVTGLMILAFIGLHMVDFFVPSISAHYVTHEHLDSYEMVALKFTNIIYVAIYLVAFIFLALHLLHGFKSAFQSVGASHPKWNKLINKFAQLYAIGIPLGYAAIAIYFYIISQCCNA